MPIPADWSERPKKAVEEYKEEYKGPEPYGPLYDKLFDSFVLTESEPAGSWEDFLVWVHELQGWGFRGQNDSAWSLRTSLDRALRVTTASGYYHMNRKAEESELLFRFRQQAHLHLGHLPSGNDLASWLALMQHHGVPTRMLDWTLSPYVALYFALEGMPSGAVDRSAVWAIDLGWLENKGQELVGPVPNEPEARAEYLNALLTESGKPAIVRIDPLHGNERMFAQQGFFLWKLFEETPVFDQILISMMIKPSILVRPVVRKIEVPGNLRIKFLEILRAMNIHRASLFPGLDGFCQSLKLDLEIKVAREATRSAP
jgi:hypothetical protein